MRKFAIFSMLVAGFFTAANAAAPVQRRGQNAANSGTSGVSSARSATTSPRGVTASSGTSVARSATSGRTIVSRSATTQPTTQGVVARAGTTQKVIGTGTKVASATKNVIVSEACQQKYDGCMDSFCMIDNASGGRCLCSDRNAELDSVLAEIEKLDQQSYQMATTGVERIEMGADADAAMAAANAVAADLRKDDEAKSARQSLDLTMWNSTVDFDGDDDVWADENASAIEGKTGDALYRASHQICVAQIPECAGEMSMLQMMYSQRIKSDCTAYENSLKQQKNASANKLSAAEKALREAALEQYRTANKYDLGQCTVEFKNCMISTGGCGDDFSKCASVVASDNTNVNKSRRSKNTTYAITGATTTIEISTSTYDTLVAKKPLCENVTKQCVAVADQVWNTFLREVAPQIKSAELIAEDNARQSCISSISSCFQKACKDTMDPNDPDGSYDMCLSRPETMLNLCKIPLNACGIDASSAAKAAESQIWDFVVARLASMRVDSCTKEVKSCLQSDDRCGKDYAQCVGLDLESIRAMCPLEKLVGCQTNGTLNSMDEIDNIITGIYLDIDNSLLETCKNAVNQKMIEICGDTASCSAFQTDDVIGTESLSSYTNNDGDFVIDGLVSFGNVVVDKTTQKSDTGASYDTYSVNINDYKSHLDDTDASVARVVSSLQSTANKIEQKIALLRQDPQVQMCVEGRNMTQIRRGSTGNATSRFPHLLDSSVMAIISGGLDQAKANYNKKYNELLASALESQNDQIKSVLCAAMASSGEPRCVSYKSDGNGNAICETYESAAFEDVFIGDTDAQTGLVGTDLYATKYVIAGAKMSDLASVQQRGRSEFVQVDTLGNMLGRVAMASVYSPTTNTCTVTTTTTTCKDTESIITTNYEKTCSKGGIHIFAGCGGGLLGLGGSKKSTKVTQVYQGTVCSEFAEPVVTSNTVKM